MNILMLFLSTFVFVLVWFLCGFIGFLIEAKINGFTEFDREARNEFVDCMVLGVISLIIMVCCCVKDWFIEFMDSLLWRIHKK